MLGSLVGAIPKRSRRRILAPTGVCMMLQCIAALVERLGDLGWFEGRTVTIEYCYAEGQSERLVATAAEKRMRYRLRSSKSAQLGDFAQEEQSILWEMQEPQATSPVLGLGAVISKDAFLIRCNKAVPELCVERHTHGYCRVPINTLL